MGSDRGKPSGRISGKRREQERSSRGVGSERTRHGAGVRRARGRISGGSGRRGGVGAGGLRLWPPPLRRVQAGGLLAPAWKSSSASLSVL